MKLLAQSAQRRLIQAGRFLRPETEPQGGGDDVGEESLVSRSRVGLGRHGCRTIAAGIDGPVLAAVRGKKSGGSCLTDLLRGALEIEIAIGIRGRENSTPLSTVVAVLPRPEIDSLSPAKLDSTNDQRVYINWQSQKRRASFSLQDNELIEHEGPPAGPPSQPERCLIHYGAPTEPGNSGSLVFNEAPEWQVISLHHAGGEYVRKLNGRHLRRQRSHPVDLQSNGESFTP